MSKKRSSKTTVNYEAFKVVRINDKPPDTKTAMQHWHEAKRQRAKAFKEEKDVVCEDFKRKFRAHLEIEDWCHEDNLRLYEELIEERKDFERQWRQWRQW